MTINPKNYPGVTVAVLVGNAGADAETKFDGAFAEARIAVSQGYKDKEGNWVDLPSAWYTIQARGEAKDAVMQIRKGDKVRVENAKQELQTFARRDGTEGLGVVLTFGDITIIPRDNAPASSDPWGAGSEAPF